MEDFFNVGTQKGIIFTQEENNFLQMKLAFLDPKKTKKIQIGTVFSLLKYSNCQGSIIKKICTNCGITAGMKNIDYDCMKKIFRGISLKQAQIEPSVMNIQANIKTKMPLFVEDSDDEEEEEKFEKEKKQPVIKKTTQQQPNRNPPVQQPPKQQQQQQQFKQQTSKRSSQQKQQVNQVRKSMNKSNVISFDQFSTPQPTKDANSKQDQNINTFNKYWLKLKVKDNVIEASQVKQLCQNIKNKSSLSDAWKLCNKKLRGKLTKGQFYAFINIVNSNSVPSSLSEQMKHIISKIDGMNTQKQNSIKNSRQTQHINNTNNTNNTNNNNNNTNNNNNNNSNNINTNTSTNNTNNNSRHEQNKNEKNMNLSSTSIKNNNNEGQIRKLEQMIKDLKQKNYKVEKQMSNLNKIQEHNNRLNAICINFKDIITKQNNLIDTLLLEKQSTNKINQDRLGVLEGYITEIEIKLNNKVSIVMNDIHNNHQIQKNEKKIIHKKSIDNQIDINQNQNKHIERRQQQQQMRINNNKENNIEQINKENQLDQEKQKQIKQIQLNVIKLVCYFNPINKQQYAKLVQKVMKFNLEELQITYSQLYQKYLQNQNRKKQQQNTKKKYEKQSNQNNQYQQNNINNNNNNNQYDNNQHNQPESFKQQQDFFAE